MRNESLDFRKYFLEVFLKSSNQLIIQSFALIRVAHFFLCEFRDLLIHTEQTTCDSTNYWWMMEICSNLCLLSVPRRHQWSESETFVTSDYKKSHFQRKKISRIYKTMQVWFFCNSTLKTTWKLSKFLVAHHKVWV